MPPVPARLAGLRQRVRRALGLELPAVPPARCEVLQLGGPGYGAWAVCPDAVPPGGVVYSFGVGEDASWDVAMIERFGVTVHAFDPTPRSIGWVRRQGLPAGFVFHPWGVAARDGTARFDPPENPAWVSHTMVDRGGAASAGAIEAPVRRVATIMSGLGHARVDLIKMDVEGAEYAVVADLLGAEPVAGGARQLLIEFHHRLPGRRLADTKACIRALRAKGFRPFHVSATGEEWSFLRDG